LFGNVKENLNRHQGTLEKSSEMVTVLQRDCRSCQADSSRRRYG
jgi:hypothetical protein